MAYKDRAAARAYATTYRALHPEKLQAYAVGYRAAHREKERLRHIIYDAIHREEHRARAAAHRAAHPEKHREYVQRRYTRKLNQFVEPVDLAVLVERDGGYCGICHKPVAAAERSIDHVLPISKGGEHSYANTRLAHRSCNIIRGNRGAAQLRLVG